MNRFHQVLYDHKLPKYYIYYSHLKPDFSYQSVNSQIESFSKRFVFQIAFKEIKKE